MKTTHNDELYFKQDNLTDKLFDENSIFFDIETTGFSPSRASVYLIGCSRKKGKYICIDQFFAEDPSEEKIVINAFIEILKQYNTIISFNGIGFDIPFLKAKCDMYNIDENFKNYNYLDIFKLVSDIKLILNLENYKQKTIEKFLNIKRDDVYSGGELINVYYDYLKSKDNKLLDALLLHNYEDVLGMKELLPILSYVEIIHGQYSIKETAIKPYLSIDGSQKNELYIFLENDYSLPRKLSCRLDNIYLTFNADTTYIRIPICECEMKYFYSNYKDYFYLPEEDIAIHKSIGQFVDKKYKEKCRAYNCYNRKSGKFIIQFSAIMNPEFKEEYKDKNSYFELTNDFCQSDIMIRRYVDHIFNHFFISVGKTPTSISGE